MSVDLKLISPLQSFVTHRPTRHFSRPVHSGQLATSVSLYTPANTPLQSFVTHRPIHLPQSFVTHRQTRHHSRLKCMLRFRKLRRSQDTLPIRYTRSSPANFCDHVIMSCEPLSKTRQAIPTHCFGIFPIRRGTPSLGCALVHHSPSIDRERFYRHETHAHRNGKGLVCAIPVTPYHFRRRQVCVTASFLYCTVPAVSA